jgi:hypothetical protein
MHAYKEMNYGLFSVSAKFHYCKIVQYLFKLYNLNICFIIISTTSSYVFNIRIIETKILETVKLTVLCISCSQQLHTSQATGPYTQVTQSKLNLLL